MFQVNQLLLLVLKKGFSLPLIAGLFIFGGNDKVPPADALKDLIDKFYSFSGKFPQQKIYIHTDKPYYLGGDDIYGKIYLINESRSAYNSARSKKIYVELINEENTIIEKTIINGIYSSLNFS